MRRRSGARVLAAVLFTDIVNSSALASLVGDRRWKELIARHHAFVRREVKRYGGNEQDTAGDGFYVSFREPAAAIRCACAIADGIRELGIEIRAGVHFGECEQVAGKLGGVTVVVGSRVMSLGDAGDVLITGTTRELIGGAGLGVEDRGRHALKGVGGEWQVFSVTKVDGAPRPLPAEGEVAERRLAGIHPGTASRRTTLTVVGAVAAVLLAVTLVVMLRTGERPALPRIPVDSVGSIDPGTLQIVDAVGIGSAPTAVAVGADAVWVLSYDAETLTRIDLRTRLTRPKSTGGHPDAVALDASGSVWVLNGLEGTVVRIDPGTMERLETIEVAKGSNDLAVGLGAVWVTSPNDQMLHTIDLGTHAEDAIGLPPEIGRPGGVAFGEAAVWVAGSTGIARIDPASEEGQSPWWPLSDRAGSVAVGAGAVWVAHLADDVVTRVEASGPVTRVSVGDGPSDLAVGGGSVWVTNSLDGTLSRIDPDANLVRDIIRVGGSPEGVAFDRGGSVWVTVHSP